MEVIFKVEKGSHRQVLDCNHLREQEEEQESDNNNEISAPEVSGSNTIPGFQIVVANDDVTSRLCAKEGTNLVRAQIVPITLR